MAETQPGSDIRIAITDMWAAVAEAWGANADELEARSAAITERMLKGTGVQRGDRILELACGAGGAGLAAAELVGPLGEVVVSDVVPAMVEIACRRAGARHLGNVTGEVLDLNGLATPDAAFDVVLCREGLMFIDARAVQRFAMSPALLVWDVELVQETNLWRKAGAPQRVHQLVSCQTGRWERS